MHTLELLGKWAASALVVAALVFLAVCIVDFIWRGNT